MPIQKINFEGRTPEFTWATKPPAAGNAGKEIIVTDMGRSRWYSNNTDWIPLDNCRTTKATLIAAYEAEQRIARIYGSKAWPRTALINPDDIPTISSVADPTTDPDPATYAVYPFLIGHAGDVPAAYKVSHLLRGYNPNLRAYRFGNSYQVPTRINQTGTGQASAGTNTDIEPGATWSQGHAPRYCSFMLDGDVFYLHQTGVGASTNTQIMVGESFVTPVISGANLAVGDAGFNFNSTINSHYVKVKFPTSARREITLVFEESIVPGRIMTRATSTLTVPHKPRLRWLAFGDSFSTSTFSDSSTVRSPTHGCSHMMHSAFGAHFDFINMAVGGSGFSPTTNLLPGATQPYADAKLASFRTQLRTGTQGLDADVITLLCGHNDDNISSAQLFTDEMRAFITDAREMHPNALLFIIGKNSSPGQLSSGPDGNGTEAKIASICAEMGATHIPMQTRNPVFLRGTGKQDAPNGSGNTDILTGPDGTHPTIKGHEVLGLQMAQDIYRVLTA